MIMSLNHFFHIDTKHGPTNIWFLGSDQSCGWKGFFENEKGLFSIPKQVFLHPCCPSNKGYNGKTMDCFEPADTGRKSATHSG